MKLLTWYQSVIASIASILVLEFLICLIQFSAEMHFPSSLCRYRQWTVDIISFNNYLLLYIVVVLKEKDILF